MASLSGSSLRLAVIADVHGNLPALEAVLEDLDRRSVDAAVNLGDCLSGPLWPAETADLLMARGLPTVRGNHDRIVAAGDVASMGPTDRFTFEALGEGHLQWLRGLPPEVAPAHGVLAVHGCRGDDMSYLLDEICDERLVRARLPQIDARLGETGAALVLCGHSHRQDLVRLPAGATVVNPGSVGCPAYYAAGPPLHLSESASPYARYAVVSLSKGRIAVDLLAVEYDHERAARRADDCGRPDWGHALRLGLARPEAA